MLAAEETGEDFQRFLGVLGWGVLHLARSGVWRGQGQCGRVAPDFDWLGWLGWVVGFVRVAPIGRGDSGLFLAGAVGLVCLVSFAGRCQGAVAVFVAFLAGQELRRP